MGVAKRMLDLKIRPGRPSVKRFFFDRQIVIDAVGRATRSVLSKYGAFVMTTARRSIRRAPFSIRGKKARERAGREGQRKANSIPGRPPFSHTGLLKSRIFFFFEPENKGVIIGPERVTKIGNAPEALEKGGWSEQRIRDFGKNPRIRRIFIRARPYMEPANEENIPKLPRMWADSVKP